MRTTLRWLLSLVVLIGTLSTAGTATAAGRDSAAPDIKDRLLAIPGMSLIEEQPYPGYRFFVLGYTQPVDHRRPAKGTFQQRLTLLHKDTSRPTVFFTSGYHLNTNPRRSEPTRIVDGNQVSLEYRFFTPSRPQPADWSKLDIWQAASDQHRLFTALKGIYDRKWVATGGSKGGMTATYYERFYPRDMDAVVAYVAPNDVVNHEDSAYDRFFTTVGSRECRARLNALQREALVRREPLRKKYAEWAAAEGATFHTVGSLDKAYEAVVLDFVWGFWQYWGEQDCASVPDAATATDDAVYDTIDAYAGWSFYTDQGLEPYTPYHYQAATELGSPSLRMRHLDGLTRYGYQPARAFVPDDIPVRFKPWVMRDVDTWVRHNARRMLFVNGEHDPWSSEPFRVDRGAKDSYVLTAPGANHGASIAGLTERERDLATAKLLEWTGVAPAAVLADPDRAAPLARYDARLDKRELMREPRFLP
ncbi:aminopeptidase [Streptomyces somaliensis]|uniref:S28 family serine protease n=1 Tax=Streptomyces somaliensis TaxID=78355 RepID=UPI0020CE4504|nr:S28 family serine protease [Streptomyces somaliensis]MCP9945772.1 aminopeptidase [Streptomyces somaliensis]MCP9961051.1 aminopeptidase [Streptomyces somaliensis]MCP9973843.1 aminopeptidase [Streptomyces somaliensis]